MPILYVVRGSRGIQGGRILNVVNWKQNLCFFIWFSAKFSVAVVVALATFLKLFKAIPLLLVLAIGILFFRIVFAAAAVTVVVVRTIFFWWRQNVFGGRVVCFCEVVLAIMKGVEMGRLCWLCSLRK